MRTSKDLSLLAVLIEDSAAVIGLLIAALGQALSQWLDMPELDGVASLLIGLLLAQAAFALGSRSRDLLVGEAASPELVDDLLDVANADPAIIHANGVLTSYLGPDELIAALSAEFRDDLHTVDIEQAILRIEDAMRVKHPELRVIYVKPQTPQVWACLLYTSRCV